ncbi:nucleoside monophosphate kinase [Candidatus Woesearchaeota archaeon]|nr:nucleoside monophosphate kinase [Candidatus Woesearchaeota archaeon]
MIITISGAPGSGKSTVAKLVAGKLGFRHYSAGDFMREIAEKRGVSLLELGKAAEKDRSIDRELDERTIQLGKREDDFVMDSRLAYHFIPTSFKVFLEVDDREAASRIFGDVKKEKAGRKVEKESTTLAATLAAIKKRRKSEELRYRKYYGLNPYDEGQYDLVIDTTKATPNKVVEKVVTAVKKSCSSC